jgi:CHAT domain-containing protein
VTLARVGTGRADLTRTIAEWRRLVLDGGDERAIGRRLFDLLVKPVETTIAQDGLVVLIADGPLNALPFGALWDGQRYFIERAAVWSAPSLEMMMWASLRLRASPLAHDWLVAVGDPAHSPIRFPTLSRLAFAAREATEVARLYAHREALVGTDAAKPRIIAALARADIVHLAAHAVANVAVPSDSFVVTADDGSDHDDLITSSDIGRLHRLPARLIVLSACETASGRIARGEGTQSIARAFMGAGIATVIANLWEVPDSRSYEFFVSLHREMAQGAAVADVLRRVQRQWLGGDNAELRQVRSWAGVVGLGATGPMRAAPASRETNSGPEHVR